MSVNIFRSQVLKLTRLSFRTASLHSSTSSLLGMLDQGSPQINISDTTKIVVISTTYLRIQIWTFLWLHWLSLTRMKNSTFGVNCKQYRVKFYQKVDFWTKIWKKRKNCLDLSIFCVFFESMCCNYGKMSASSWTELICTKARIFKIF